MTCETMAYLRRKASKSRGCDTLEDANEQGWARVEETEPANPLMPETGSGEWCLYVFIPRVDVWRPLQPVGNQRSSEALRRSSRIPQPTPPPDYNPLEEITPLWRGPEWRGLDVKPEPQPPDACECGCGYPEDHDLLHPDQDKDYGAIGIARTNALLKEMAEIAEQAKTDWAKRQLHWCHPFRPCHVCDENKRKRACPTPCDGSCRTPTTPKDNEA